MQAAYEEAFRSAALSPPPQAGTTTAAAPTPVHEVVDAYDLYACFPIAVEHACDALQIEAGAVPVTKITQTGVPVVCSLLFPLHSH